MLQVLKCEADYSSLLSFLLSLKLIFSFFQFGKAQWEFSDKRGHFQIFTLLAGKQTALLQQVPGSPGLLRSPPTWETQPFSSPRCRSCSLVRGFRGFCSDPPFWKTSAFLPPIWPHLANVSFMPVYACEHAVACVIGILCSVQMETAVSYPNEEDSLPYVCTGFLCFFFEFCWGGYEFDAFLGMTL